MEDPRGRVIQVSTAAASRHALVEVDAGLQCERCALGKGCGAGLLGATQGSRRIDALVSAGLSLTEGDQVRIQLAPGNVLRASLLVYGTPLFVAVGAAIVAYVAGLGDLLATLASVAGLLVGVQIARLRLQQSHCLRSLTPTVVERIVSHGS
ncbi:MAG: SoxR reducing system RseC family protein [Woeseiaceae bacterium]